MNIAFLGLGKMGTPMVRRLVAAGHQLTVWNRTRARAEALTGVTVADSPAAAVLKADAVFTSLFDDAAHQAVLFGEQGILNALPPGTVHISLSTMSVAFGEQLTAEHARRNQPFVAAPVFGRPNLAEQGRLWIVAAGAALPIAQARPLLQPLSRGLSIIGTEPPQAYALKLGGNFLITAMIHSLSESFVYAQAQGIQPDLFLETVNSALFQSPFYESYGKIMLHPQEKPGATLDLGDKDIQLLRQAAAGRQTNLSLADNLAEIFAQAKQIGLGGEDWAVGQFRMAQQRGKLS